MSLENKIDQLIVAVEQLTNVALNMVKSATVSTAAPVVPQQGTQELLQRYEKPLVTQAPQVTVAPVVTQMPAPPTFMTAMVAPSPTVAPGGAPFNDPKGLIEYTTTVYEQMGKEKGSQIQKVIESLGYQNLNSINPGHYAAFYAGVEALRNS